MPLDPQAQQVVDLVEAVGLLRLTPDSDPVEQRALMNAAVLPSDLELAVIEDREIPGPGGALPVRVYRPDGDAAKPLVVFFHGGGWVVGSIATHDSTCRSLADALDAVVVSVDYRLAPEHKFPAALDDCAAALAWSVEHAVELGADPARVVLAGDSAGGNLAAVVAQLARESGPAISFQLLVYPVTDCEFDSRAMIDNAEGYFLTRYAMQWFFAQYLEQEGQGDDPRVSPLRATDLGGLPPAFIVTAEYDPLRDQGIAYAERLAAAGTPCEVRTYPGMFHGFFGMGAQITAAQPAFDDAVAAVQAALDGSR
jgi:acetyl esterase